MLHLIHLFYIRIKISESTNGEIKNDIILSTYYGLIGESSNSGKYQTRTEQLLKCLVHQIYLTNLKLLHLILN
jgi:hypothetical protein